MTPSDPVSCLLCLDAHERPTMLPINLRPIGVDGGRVVWLCMICGGAIAAEYLFRENEKKADRVEVVDNLEPETQEKIGNVEISSGVVVAATDAEATPAPASGEGKTVELEPLSTDGPTTVQKKGRKEAR
jgi:hypothetical protein